MPDGILLMQEHLTSKHGESDSLKPRKRKNPKDVIRRLHENRKIKLRNEKWEADMDGTMKTLDMGETMKPLRHS